MFKETEGKGQLETAPSIKEISDETMSKTVYFSISGIDILFLFNEELKDVDDIVILISGQHLNNPI